MIQTGIKLKNIVDFVKEHLSVLIVVPAFIGGLWQAIELMSISMPYIRFFSISQIVSDGILILMLFIIASSLYFLVWFADILFLEEGNEEPAEALNAEDYEIYRRNKLRYSLIYFILTYVVSFVLFYHLFDDKTTLIDYIIIIAPAFFCVYVLNRSLNICYYCAKDKHKKLFKACNVLLVVFYLLLAFKFGKQIHYLLITPTNIITIEQVKNDISHKFPNTKQKLLYFNDKYVFIKITTKPIKDKKGKLIKSKSERVYITKLDDMFINESLKN